MKSFNVLLWRLSLKVFVSLAAVATNANADIRLMDALKYHKIGTKTDHIILGDIEDEKGYNTRPESAEKRSIHKNKLQSCYDDVQKKAASALRANKKNDPASNIGLVTLGGSVACTQAYKRCSERAWQAGKNCFAMPHPGMTPVQIANKCNTISNSGAIKCALAEVKCSQEAMKKRCDREDMGQSPKDHSANRSPLSPQTEDLCDSSGKEEYGEQIAQYQQDIETLRDRIDRARVRLDAELKYGPRDKYHQRRIQNLKADIRSAKSLIQNYKNQLQAMGAHSCRHIVKDNRDVYRDAKANSAIYGEQKARREFQSEQEKNVKFINTFVSGDEWSDAYNRIKRVDKTGDKTKARKLYSAHKKIYYDSRQAKLQAKTAYEKGKADVLKESSDYLNKVKDTSLTINKVLARMDPTGTGEKIVGWQEDVYDAVEGYEKGGAAGAVGKIVMKKADEKTGDWASFGKEKLERYKKYVHEGIELREDELYYDRNGKRLKKVKRWQKVYDKDGNDVSFSFARRLGMDIFLKVCDDRNAIKEKVDQAKELIDNASHENISGTLNVLLDMTGSDDENRDENSGKKGNSHEKK